MYVVLTKPLHTFGRHASDPGLADLEDVAAAGEKSAVGATLNAIALLGAGAQRRPLRTQLFAAHRPVAAVDLVAGPVDRQLGRAVGQQRQIAALPAVVLPPNDLPADQLVADLGLR